jgi:hypothetical protein
MLATQHRRAFERVPFFADVLLTSPVGGHSVAARSVDISLGGVGLICPGALTPGEPVVLTFRLPTGTGVVAEERLLGRVAHVRSDEAGQVLVVEFSAPLSRHSAPLLTRMIERL